MSLLHLVILATIQGLTEFLPVSSSGHLAVLPILSGSQDQGYLMDAAAHFGTLLAVILYFRHDVAALASGLVDLLAGRVETESSRLAMNIIIATIPIMLAGLLLHYSGLAHLLRNLAVIGFATMFFGIILYIADRFGIRSRGINALGRGGALSLGIAQILALVPGVSRSGITITAARMMGFTRHDAVRVSMLMAVPTIAMAGLLAFSDMASRQDSLALMDGMLVAAISFCVGYGAIHAMMRLLRRFSFTPYVIYRVALGSYLLLLAYQ